MKRTRLSLLVAALAAALASAWFFSSFDRVTVQTYVGYRGAARQNDYLAAERLFNRLGAAARELRSLPELASLPARGVLVLPAERTPLGPAQLDAVLAWVGQGGRVVLEAHEAREHDALLARLRVSRATRGDSPRRPDGSCAPAGATFVQIPGREEPLLAELPRDASLRLPRREVRWKADSHAGTQLAALTRGDGEILVATSLDFLRNAEIGRHDHAELAWLLAGEEPGREIRIFNQPHKLSLLDWLLEHARPALAGAALLLALWLWRVVPRFGPLVPEPAPGRRRLLEHLRAAGRHQWVAGNVAALYRAAREACLARVLRAHPEAAGLATDAMARRLGEILDLPAARIESALGAQSFPEPHAFASAVSTLQALHERLARAPRKAVPRSIPPLRRIE